MSADPFRTFTVFNVRPDDGFKTTPLNFLTDNEVDPDLEPTTADPGPGDWSHMGFAHADTEGAYIHDIDGAGVLVNVRISERILPAKVVREEVEKRAAAYEERQGKLNRKEWAELKFEVEQSMLGKAFVRRRDIYCLFTSNNRLIVFNGSAKKVDATIAFLQEFMRENGTPFVAELWGACENASLQFNRLITSPDSTAYCNPTDNAVLKHPEEGVVRIKDQDLSAREVISLIKRGFMCTEIGLAYDEEEESEIRFRLTENFIFKGCIIPGLKLKKRKGDDEEDERHDWHGSLWIVATTIRELIQSVENTFQSEEDDEL